MARRAVAEEMADTAQTPGAARSVTAVAPTSATLDPPRWRGRLAGPFAPLRLAATGVRRTFGLLLAVTVGILAAIVLICTVPLYTSLDSQVQVYHTLTTSKPSDINVEVTAQVSAVQPGVADRVFTQIDTLESRWTGDFTAGSTRFLLATGQMRMTQVNGVNQSPRSGVVPVLPPDSRGNLYGFDFSRTGPHMHLYAGQLPQDNPADGVPQVLITNRMANVNVGDTLTLQAFGSTDQIVTVRVAGIWYPTDENEPFWNGHGFDTTIPEPPPAAPTFFPIVFSMNTFAGALNFKPQIGERPMGMLVDGVYYTDPSKISADRLATTLDNVKFFRAQVSGNLPGRNGVFTVGVFTNIDKLLAGLNGELSLLSLPLYVVVAQLVGLALLFVVAMAGILVDGQAVEIATLKSRGASGTQLLIGYALQGLLLAALSAAAAPTLAALLSISLVRSFVPSAAGLLAGPFGQRYVSGAASSQAVLLPAVVGAALGVAAVAAAALRSARLDVLALRREQGRSTSVPFWKRYYLDVALAVLCGVGYLELGQFGGLNVRSALGSDTSTASGPDPLLLVSPALLLLAGALLALRIFPLAAQLGARVAARDRGATGMLAFAQLARGADAFARLTLLLTLAVGLGLFALTFQASLAQNARDRAAYLAGSDELVHLSLGTSGSLSLRDRYVKLPGVLGATPVYRTLVTGSDQIGGNAPMLAIDSSSFAGVANWRDDYASAPLAQLMAQMHAHLQGAHAGEDGHPIWILVDQTFAANFHVRAGDRLSLSNTEGEAKLPFVVGGIVDHFPTMFDGQLAGYLVVDMNDYFAALTNPVLGGSIVNGPNEMWLRTSDDPQLAAARAKALTDANLLAAGIVDRRTLADQFATEPLAAGMSGLLLVGAVTAAALAVIGSLVQAALSARQRVRQFAILRTLGTSGGQLVRMLLGEQLIVYLFGLAGGTALGAVLATATLPFLQFSSSLASPDQVGVPPYQLVLNMAGAAAFYGALLVAFVVALVMAAQVAATVGLGKTLRLGED
jgi:ABC-type lipoprotein release transport system permease subunit